MNTDSESLVFFYVCLTSVQNNQILINKISHLVLLITKIIENYSKSPEPDTFPAQLILGKTSP
jgi:hypothetical protein